jgi:hypothetical protein
MIFIGSNNLCSKHIPTGILMGLGLPLLVGYSLQLKTDNLEYAEYPIGLLVISIVECMQLLFTKLREVKRWLLLLMILSIALKWAGKTWSLGIFIPILYRITHYGVLRALRHSITYGEGILISALASVSLFDLFSITIHAVFEAHVVWITSS